MQVGVIGHVLPLRHPVQTAEEFAQMDVLSGGRFIGGVVRGVPQEYVSYNVDPFTSRERFAECFDILQRSLTEELFDYEGRFYNLKAVSVWPKPLQNPLPIWMPAGSAETIEFAAERRIPIARVWSPTVVFQDAFEYYRMVAKEKFGWDAGPEYAIGSRYVHVAETNEKAIEECREAVMYVRRLSTFSRPVQVARPQCRAYRLTAPSITANGTRARRCQCPAPPSTGCGRTASSSAATRTTLQSGWPRTWRRLVTATSSACSGSARTNTTT